MLWNGNGTPEGIRTPGLLLRRQLLYPTELLAHILERVTRIELASPAWKAGALAIVLHPRMGRPRFAATNRQLINNSTNERICQGPKEKFSIKIRAGAYWYRR